MMGFVKKRYIALIAVGVLLLLAVTFLFQSLTIYDSQVIAKEAGGEPSVSRLLPTALTSATSPGGLP